MDVNEGQQCLDKMQQLWPSRQFNETEIREWIKVLTPLPFSIVLAAITEHWITADKGYLTPARLIGLAKAKAQAGYRPQAQERVIDWLRHKSMDGPRYRGLEDLDALRWHFEEAWKATKLSGADETSIQRIRRLIYSHAVSALIEIRWKENEARDIAGTFVGLEPGHGFEKTQPILRSLMAEAKA